MTFKDLFQKWPWRQIKNCPGRYVLPFGKDNPSMAELVGNEADVFEFQVDTARDIVVISKIKDGGIISYKKPDGSLLHTLNSPTGFNRKLKQLGIRIPLK